MYSLNYYSKNLQFIIENKIYFQSKLVKLNGLKIFKFSQ